MPAKLTPTGYARLRQQFLPDPDTMGLCTIPNCQAVYYQWTGSGFQPRQIAYHAFGLWLTPAALRERAALDGHQT